MSVQSNLTNASIAVVGTGYVGLTTGACMAHLGHSVICVDNDEQKLNLIRDGVMPIHEAGLGEIVIEEQKSGRLSFSTNLAASVSGAEFIFLCLPTPTNSDGEADLSAIHNVLALLKLELNPGVIVINKSTVPVNSVAKFAELLDNPLIHVVSNPEFLREGSAVEDFLKPDRVLIGGKNQNAISKTAKLYEKVKAPIISTDAASAESIKYMANAFLAMKISFVNQVSQFCETIGADVLEVMKGLSMDPRIGDKFLSPGPGWGGSCFPKDTRALIEMSNSVGSPMTLINETVVSNERHIQNIVELIRSHVLLLQVSTPKIGVLGLSFKANTDDTRSSPALEIIQRLQLHFPNIVAYDPVAKVPSNFVLVRVDTVLQAVDEADVVLLLTEWDEFSALDPQVMKNSMRSNVIIDTRYILNRVNYAQHGLRVIQYGVPELSHDGN